MKIVPYSPALQPQWDAFVDASKNGTFLFRRAYMDYHADRFTDGSLMIFGGDGDDTLRALLPASLHGREVRSHGGLTYGGLILDHKASGCGPDSPLEMLPAIAGHYRSRGFDTLLYKPVPHIYHTEPAEEDLYALWRMGATLAERNLATAIHLGDRPRASLIDTRAASWQRVHGVTVHEVADPQEIWGIIADNLQARYGVAPVHTLDEIRLLHSRFPECIRMFAATDGAGAPLCGAVFYVTRHVAHLQYWGTNDQGKKSHAEEVLTAHLAKHTFADKRWLDFGISNEDHGRYLNPGLLHHKERYGARGIVYDTYSLRL